MTPTPNMKLTFACALLAVPLTACVAQVDSDAVRDDAEHLGTAESELVDAVEPHFISTDRVEASAYDESVSAAELDAELPYPLEEIGADQDRCSVDAPDDPAWAATECIVKPYMHRGDPMDESAPQEQPPQE